MHRLEIRELRLIAGLDERLERRLHERRDATAEQRLLAEQVGLGLLGEGGLEHTGACRAEAAGIGKDAVASGPGGVTLDGEQCRDTTALAVHATKQMPRA